MSGLGKGRVCMDRVHDIRDSSLQSHSRHSFRNYFRDRVADHMDAEDFAIFRIRNDFDESLSGILDFGFADRRERELPDLCIVSGLSGLRFSQTNTRDLGITISAGGY